MRFWSNVFAVAALQPLLFHVSFSCGHAMGSCAANGTVNIQMMDYIPANYYTWPKTYWNVIDNAIRAISFK